MGVFSSPSIPLDGLVFSIDAGNAKSYSGSGTNVNDLVTGTVETLTNGVSYSSNLSGYFSFDGVDDLINVGSLGTFTTQGTISFWMNSLDVQVAIRNPFSTNYNGFNTNVLRFEIGESIGSLKVWIGSGGLASLNFSTINVNTWYHVLVTWNQSTNSFIGYLNGSLNVSSSSWTLWPTAFVNVGIGTGYNRYFGGFISNVQIYNRALSAVEVAQLYNATKDRYSYKADIIKNGLLLNYDIASQISYINPSTTIQSTINNYIGTLTNGPTYNSGNGGYLSFDGTNDYINILPSSATFSYNRSSFTVGGWTYMTSLPVSYFGVILSKWNSGGGNDNEFILNTDDGNKFLFAVDLDDSLTPNAQTNDLVISNTTIVANAWYYVVGTFENGTIKLYVNGVLESSVTNILTTVKTNLNSSLDIGRFGTSFYSTGRRAVIHMYNRALTSTEILSNFNALRGRYGI